MKKETICHGMVVTWMMGCFSDRREEFEVSWFKAITAPAEDSDSEEEDLDVFQLRDGEIYATEEHVPHPLSRPYVVAKLLQMIYNDAGKSLFKQTGSVAKSNKAAIEWMYKAAGLKAKCIPGQYIQACDGASLLVGMLSNEYSHYHVSLKVNPEGGGHAIGLARDEAGRIYLFDPNMGMFCFASFTRFKALLPKMYQQPKQATYGSLAVRAGDYAKYPWVCWWGISRA